MLTKNVIKFIEGYYEVNKFYHLANKADCSYSVFFLKRHISNHVVVVDDPILVSGVCEAYKIVDSDTLHIGFLFRTIKARTKISPILLSVKIPPDQSDYKEIILPPKFGVLAYKSSNGSTLIVAQEELDLQYIIKDAQL